MYLPHLICPSLSFLTLYISVPPPICCMFPLSHCLLPSTRFLCLILSQIDQFSLGPIGVGDVQGGVVALKSWTGVGVQKVPDCPLGGGDSRGGRVLATKRYCYNRFSLPVRTEQIWFRGWRDLDYSAPRVQWLHTPLCRKVKVQGARPNRPKKNGMHLIRNSRGVAAWVWTTSVRFGQGVGHLPVSVT